MRLLHYTNDGGYSLTQFFDNIPRYAILSHTWGPEEVTFKDMKEGNRTTKAGFDKIRFCGEQARHDGLQYFWVDTCCIDKSSSAELAEAINSMFRWYRDAAKCYVFLSDVPRTDVDNTDQSYSQRWESAFRTSRWFTRGWTLQELLAPQSVEFFSQEGKRIGDKWTLERQVYEITGIPVPALRGAPLSQFDIEDRFTWAKDRQTTREEDKAYSLFGIFDIQIPVLYGEGKEKALARLREELNKPLKDKVFKRLYKEGDIPLKELDRLPSAAGAAFNSFNRQQHPTCLSDTRVSLLQEICDWTDGQDERRIFWLNGLLGTGKSTIARTIAQRYYKEERLGASFFFSRGDGDVSHAGKFFTSIAVQLANNIPSLRHYICDAIANCKDIASRSFREQWSQLILFPFSKLSNSSSSPSYVLVIDALDECDNDEHIQMILQLLAEVRTLKTARLRVFLTSRPEIPIRHGICTVPQAEHQDFVLYNIQLLTVDHDISLFLEYNLRKMGQDWTLGADWPGEEVLRQLVLHASGLFIWAATACRFIREGKRRFARKRLDTIIKGSSSDFTAPEKHLNEIYLDVLNNSISLDFSVEEKREAYNMLKHTLGSLVVLFSPLSTSSLSRLLQLSVEDVDLTFENLYAILDIPEDSTYPLRLYHPSFRDFLLNKDQCRDYWVDEKEAHQILATCCIQLMSQTLKKDICQLYAPGYQVAQVESSRIQKCLPPEVQYACLYWVQHLQRSGSQAYDGEKAHRFLQAHLLHWLEALGWIGRTLEGIQAILSLEAYVLVNESPNLYAFICDAKRFALYNRSVIEQVPLQLYCSALIFAPEKSIVRRQFETSIPAWIRRKPRVQADWSAALQTLEGHSDSVSSVAFSPDGKQVVSGSYDETVRLWDAATGALLQTLKGHSHGVTSVAFSPDGKQVVSSSSDRTVRLWDAATGVALQTLEGHSNSVSLVVFSPDSKQVASGSDDWTVRLWDASTGAALQTLAGHSGSINSVAFSPDSKQVVSGSDDRTVWLWDATVGAPLQTLEGHRGSINLVAFSPDGKQVMSSSSDRTVRLWDAATGLALQTLENNSHSVPYVAFLTHGKPSTLHVSSHWLVEGTTNILLLPANYRPTCEAVWDGSIILGHSSGRISFLQIKEGPKYGFYHAAAYQGSMLPFQDSAFGSLEGSLAIGLKQEVSIGNDSGLFSNDDVSDRSNEDDIKSIPSVTDDIQSQSSTKRTAQYKIASDQIGELLARHKQLGPLYEVVLPKIGKKRLVENLRRLLKQYYLDLSKTAQTNLEKASVSPLRSRWNRVRIAQRITDIVDPEIVNDPEPSVSEVPDNRARLESWLSSNPGFNQRDKIVNEAATTQLDKTWFGQTEIDQVSEPDSDNIYSDRSDYGHNVEHPNVFPKIAEVEKFFLEGDSFRRLLMSLQTFLLPVSLSSLTRVLMSVPKDDVWFSDKNDNSIMNKFKIAIENITEENWHWWPMRPKMRMLQGNRTRVHWRCRCGTHLWAELLKPHAEIYKALLARKVDDPLQRRHLCTSRRGKSFGGTWTGWINQALGTSFWPASKTQAPSIPLHNTLQAGPQTHRQPPERARTPIGISLSRSIPALATDQGAGVLIPATSELFVLFAVQGARRTLELAHIKVDQNVDDEAFFRNIRIRYKEKRGFIRYWLSIWQLKDCEMAMFKKVQKGRVLFTKNDLPTDDLYEYTPKPPMTELPHVFPHEFEFALRPPCKAACPLASFHDCVEPRCGNAILERIPKRKCRLQLTDNQPEEAWGLKAHYTPHFLLVLVYHCLVFVTTFAFWIWWLFVHPDDLQNASVPFMAAVAIVSMFWSSVATLKALQ